MTTESKPKKAAAMKNAETAPLSVFEFNDNVIADVKRIVKMASDLSIETMLECSPTEFKFRGMDGSHIGLVYAEIPCAIKNPQNIGVNMGDLHKLIEKRKEFTWEFNPTTHKLKVVDKRFRLSLQEIDIDGEINIDSILDMKTKINTNFSLAVEDFKEMLEAAEHYSEVVAFKTVGENIQAHTDGTIGDMEVDLNLDICKTLEVKDAVESVAYAIEFLKQIPKVFKTPTFFLRSETPLIVEELFESQCKLMFTLAPRVAEDGGAATEEE